MKRNKFATPKTAILAATAVALILIPALVWGQPGRGSMGRHGDGPPDFGFLIHRLSVELDLSPQQQEEVRELMEGRRESFQAGREQARQAREAVAAAIHAETFDEGAIRAAAQGVAELEIEQAVRVAAALAEFRQILTPDQQALAKELMAEHQEMRQHRKEFRRERFEERRGERFGDDR